MDNNETSPSVIPEGANRYTAKTTGYQALARKYFPILAQLQDVESFRLLKEDILTSAQITVLKYALSPAKLEKASFSSLCSGFETLAKMQRLEAGQSTENIAHQHLGSISLQLPQDIKE